MKLKFFKFIFLFFYFSSIFSESNQEKFLKANNLFIEGKFKEAVELYDSISKKGVNEWYNIGNSYFKSGDYAKAIGNWKKAFKYASFDNFDDIKSNINVAYKKINKEINLGLFDHFYIFAVKYVSLIPILIFQIIFLICWYLLILFWKNLIKIRFLNF